MITLKLIASLAQPNHAWLWQTEQAEPIEFGSELYLTSHENKRLSAKAWHNEMQAHGKFRSQWLSETPWPADWQAGDLIQANQLIRYPRPTQITEWTKQPQIWLADRFSFAWLLAAAKERQLACQAGLPISPMIALVKNDPQLPVQLKPARYLLNLTHSALAAVPLLEDWGVVNRVVHPLGLPGCYEGELADLLTDMLKQQSSQPQQTWWLMGQVTEQDKQACEAIMASPNLRSALQSYNTNLNDL